MLGVRYFALIFVFGVPAHSSILLQARGKPNNSNVDSLIDKVVPNDKPLDGRRHYADLRQDRADNMFSIKVEKKKGGTHDAIDVLVEKFVGYLRSFSVDAEKRNYKNKIITPGIIQFKSSKPSTMLEINTSGVVDYMKKLLKSKALRQYADSLAEKAVVVYRALKQEMENSNK